MAETPAQMPPQAQPPAPTLDLAFNRLYNLDFAGAHATLDAYIGQHPEDPLPRAVRGSVYLFSGLDRLHVLETDFFLDEDKLLDNHDRIKPDPEIKKKMLATIEDARALAQVRLQTAPEDRDALLALCLSANVVAEYTTLVEHRRWQGMGLAKQSVAAANKLLALTPPVYDAYNTVGSLEYILGSMPFFVRWFIRYDQVEGDKRKGIEDLKLVALHGRFLAPFARVLLSVISLREGKLEDARQLLAGLVADFPDNVVMKRELKLVTDRIARSKPRT